MTRKCICIILSNKYPIYKLINLFTYFHHFEAHLSYFSLGFTEVLELVLRVAAATSVVYLRRPRAAAPWARRCVGRWLNDAAGESTRPPEPWTRNTRAL